MCHRLVHTDGLYLDSTGAAGPHEAPLTAVDARTTNGQQVIGNKDPQQVSHSMFCGWDGVKRDRRLRPVMYWEYWEACEVCMYHRGRSGVYCQVTVDVQ